MNLKNKYKVSRANLLMMVILGLINVVLGAFGASTYFPFSPIFPWIVSWTGYGMSKEVEGGILFVIVALVIALLSLLPYLLCWLFSKKHKIWMYIALALFSVDCIFLLWLALFPFDPGFLIDIAFHGWVMYYLITGVRHGDEAGKEPVYVEGMDPGGMGAAPLDGSVDQNGAPAADQTGMENTDGKENENGTAVDPTAIPSDTEENGYFAEDWNKPQE